MASGIYLNESVKCVRLGVKKILLWTNKLSGVCCNSLR